MDQTFFLSGFVIVLSLSSSTAVSSEGDDPLDWLRDSIPGEPGVDYPILSSAGETSFTCSGLVFGGYYADPDQDCQVFHVCLHGGGQDGPDGQDGQDDLSAASFLCPNGTLFAQDRFICDWWFNVDCSASVSLYPAVEGAFGQAGGDCPFNGLCCFDGCADTCVDGPKPNPQPRPQLRPTKRPAPIPQPRPTQRPAPRPQPVVIEEEEVETIVNPVIKTTRRPNTPSKTTSRPRPTQPAPTTYRPAFTTPKTTTGYSYETPDPDLPSLYGPPAPGRRGRTGRRG